jgi:hypothetical protein
MYVKKTNKNYVAGDKNGNSKLTWEDAALIVDMVEYRDKRIDEIDLEIEKLKAERVKLKSDVSQKQLALKFDVSDITIRRLVQGKTWGRK